ncbi:hypothetical protein ACMZ5D_16685, partial [Acinetobacter baumannii]
VNIDRMSKLLSGIFLESDLFLSFGTSMNCSTKLWDQLSLTLDTNVYHDVGAALVFWNRKQ